MSKKDRRYNLERFGLQFRVQEAMCVNHFRLPIPQRRQGTFIPQVGYTPARHSIWQGDLFPVDRFIHLMPESH
jgi:hypothetical protein